MKRRSFLQFLASLAPAPIIARDMADFDFLDTPGIPREVEPAIPVKPPPIRYVGVYVPVTGELRYNTTKYSLEWFDGENWRNSNGITNSNR